jgi:hypothetical protein
VFCSSGSALRCVAGCATSLLYIETKSAISNAWHNHLENAVNVIAGNDKDTLHIPPEMHHGIETNAGIHAMAYAIHNIHSC